MSKMATVSDDSEEEISPVRSRHTPSRKRQILDGSSDENGNESGHSDTNQVLCRSSERIRRRHSREFKLPDKHKYWRDMQTNKTPTKSWHLISPRKLVNDLTKVNNRYNAETFDSDDDYDNLDEFIVDDDEESEDSCESCDSVGDVNTKGRIDRRRTLSETSSIKRHRICSMSSSDSDTDDKNTNNVITSDTKIDSQLTDCDGVRKQTGRNKKSFSLSSDEQCDSEPENKNNDICSDSDSECVLRTNNFKKKRVVDSESESDENFPSSSKKMRSSASKRVKQRKVEREQMFQGLKDSRRKSS